MTAKRPKRPAYDRERIIAEMRARCDSPHLSPDQPILVCAGEIRCLLDGPEFARVNSVAGLDAWAKKIGEAATAPVPETVSPLIAHLRGVDRRDALIHAGEDLYQAAREASAPTSPEREAGSWERLEYALADWRLVVDGGGKP